MDAAKWMPEPMMGRRHQEGAHGFPTAWSGQQSKRHMAPISALSLGEWQDFSLLDEYFSAHMTSSIPLGGRPYSGEKLNQYLQDHETIPAKYFPRRSFDTFHLVQVGRRLRADASEHG